MANPTTNFGWVMPTSASLVTNLPADFNVFGQGVDTSMQYLLGGTTGQILSKTSGTNMAFTWIANDQGDITGVTAGTGISVSSPTGPVPTVSIDTAVTADLTTAQTLTNKKLSDSTTTIVDVTDATKAIKFDVAGTTAVTGTIATAFTTAKTVTIPDTTGTVALTNGVVNNTLTSTTGDIIYASAANTPARLGIGSTSQVLTVSGGIPSWATPASGASFVGCSASARASQSIANNTVTAIALNTEQFDSSSMHSTTVNNSRFTIPTGYTGKWLFTAVSGFDPLTTGNMILRFYVNGASIGLAIFTGNTNAGTITSTSITNVLNLLAGDYVELMIYQNSGISATTMISGTEDFTFMNCHFIGA